MDKLRFIAGGLTLSQARALLRLEPNVLYDLSVMHGIVRQSLWRLQLIETVQGGRAGGTLKIRLTVFGRDVRGIIDATDDY